MLLKEERDLLEVLTHALCQRAESDAREEVDAESRVFRVVAWEHIGVCILHCRLCETSDQGLQAEDLEHLLEQNLHKDAGRRSSVVFVHVNDFEASP